MCRANNDRLHAVREGRPGELAADGDELPKKVRFFGRENGVRAKADFRRLELRQRRSGVGVENESAPREIGAQGPVEDNFAFLGLVKVGVAEVARIDNEGPGIRVVGRIQARRIRRVRKVFAQFRRQISAIGMADTGANELGCVWKGEKLLATVGNPVSRQGIEGWPQVRRLSPHVRRVLKKRCKGNDFRVGVARIVDGSVAVRVPFQQMPGLGRAQRRIGVLVPPRHGRAQQRRFCRGGFVHERRAAAALRRIAAVGDAQRIVTGRGFDEGRADRAALVAPIDPAIAARQGNADHIGFVLRDARAQHFGRAEANRNDRLHAARNAASRNDYRCLQGGRGDRAQLAVHCRDRRLVAFVGYDDGVAPHLAGAEQQRHCAREETDRTHVMAAHTSPSSNLASRSAPCPPSLRRPPLWTSASVQICPAWR